MNHSQKLPIFFRKCFLGTIASFNWDTSQTSNTKTALFTQFHLSDQYYNICIRRTQGYCSLCLSPQILHSGTPGTSPVTEGASFGVSAGSVPIGDVTSNSGPGCTGVTTFNAINTMAAGLGMLSTRLKC